MRLYSWSNTHTIDHCSSLTYFNEFIIAILIRTTNFFQILLILCYKGITLIVILFKCTSSPQAVDLLWLLLREYINQRNVYISNPLEKLIVLLDVKY